MGVTSTFLEMTGKAFEALSGRDLRKAVSSLRSTARKRAARLDAGGYDTPALSKLNKEGGLPTVKGLTESELRSEFQKYRNFLNDKTSTVSGFKSFRSDVIEGLRNRGVDISPENFQEFFEAYEELKDLDPSVENRRLKYKTMRELADTLQEGPPDFEDLILKMQEAIQDIYEEEEGADYDEGVSSFF